MRRQLSLTLSHNRNTAVLNLGSFLAVMLTIVPLFTVSRVLATQPIASNENAALPDDSPTPTPNPTPTEEQLKLEQEKRLIELQRDIELAKKAIRDAQPQPAPPPPPSATPLAGDTTLNDVKLEPEIVSYKAMSEAAMMLVRDIDAKLAAEDGNGIKIRTLSIYDAQIVKDWRFYQALFPAFEGQVKDIKQQYQDLLCADPDTNGGFKTRHCDSANMPKNSPRTSARMLVGPAAVQGAFAAGTTLVKSFIDLASLFRTDTKLEGKSLTIDESALVAEVFRELKNKHKDNLTLYYPEVFPPRANPDERSPTVTIIGELFLFKAEADRLIKLKGEQNEADQKTLEEPTAKKHKASQELGQLKQFKETLQKLEESLAQETSPITKRKLRAEIARTKTELSKLVVPDKVDFRIKELTLNITLLEDRMKPIKATLESREATTKSLRELNERFLKFVDQFLKPDNTGTNALTLFIKSEDIQLIMGDHNCYWLEIKAVSAGGNNRTRKNLIWFFTGPRVDHSGGVILNYTIYDRTGAVVLSDKLTHYEGYREPKRLINNKKPDEKEFKDPVP